MSRPKKLYKYQSLSNYSLRNLKKNCIYFNDPNEFNDPYDTTQPIEFEDISYDKLIKLVFDDQRGDIPKLFMKLRDNSINATEFSQFFFFISTQIPNIKSKLSHEIKLNGNISEKIINEIINNSQSEFNRFKDFVKKELESFLNQTIKTTIDSFREYTKNYGVSCFSEKVDDILMWSYYADGHKGFCIEYETGFEPFQNSFKVNYVKTLQRVDLSKVMIRRNNPFELVQTLLGTKYINWCHEKEWRIIHTEKNKEYYLKPIALTGVYFGAKMNFTDFEIISLILKGQNPYTRLYRMKKVPGEFMVEPEEINYTTFQEAKNIVFGQISEKLKKGIFDVNELLKDVKISAGREQIKSFIENLIDETKLQGR